MCTVDWFCQQLMTLSELADASGLPTRTIRFYIARGLVSGPAKSGRDADYTSAHLERIERIKKLQAEGRTLGEIGRLFDGNSEKAAAPDPQAWWQYPISDRVQVWVKAGTNPWLTKQLRALTADYAQAVRDLEEKSGENE